MKTHQKTALSLLISVLAFSAVAVLMYSGLFEYIETNFYDPRVRDRVQSTLERGVDALATYHDSNQQRFRSILEEPAVRSVYRVNQSREDILARRNFFGRLEDQVPALAFVRFVDADGERLWYSNRPGDIVEESDFRREYAALTELEETPAPADLVLQPDAQSDIILDANSNHFIFRFPVEDAYGLVRGTALFYLNPSGATDALVRNDVIGASERVVIVGDDLMVANQAARFGEAFRERTAGLAEELGGGEGHAPVIAASSGAEYLVFSSEVPGVGRLAYLSPASAFTMNETMRWILLSATFLSVFLLTFLLLNLRQDPEVVLSERVKRFQINLLREMFERGEKPDWEQKRIELEERRDEVNREIKRGIGRLSPDKEKEVDSLLNKSWDEIVNIIDNRTRPEQRSDGIDLERLEEMIEKVMSNFASLPGAGPAGESASNTSETAATPPGPRQQAEEAEEAEELSEAEEPEELEEAEEPAEAEAEEPSTTGESSEAEDFTSGMRPVEVESAEDEGELEELGEAAEAEEAEEAEELEEAEEPEELEEAEEVEELEEAEEPAEAEEAESTEATGDVAEFGTFEETAELEQMRGRKGDEAETVEGQPPAEHPPTDEELLKDLDGVKEEWEKEGEEPAPAASSGGPGVERPGDGQGLLSGNEPEDTMEIEGLDMVEEVEEPDEGGEAEGATAPEEPAGIPEAEEADEGADADEVEELEELEEISEVEEPTEAAEPLEELEELEEVEEAVETTAAERAEATSYTEEKGEDESDVEELETVDAEESAVDVPRELSAVGTGNYVRMSDWFSFQKPGDRGVGDSEEPEEEIEEAELIEELEEPEEPEEPESPEPAQEEGEPEPEEEGGVPYEVNEDLIVITSPEETDNNYYQLIRLDLRLQSSDAEKQVFTADDGIVQIDGSVYEESAESQREDVKDLVDSVTGESEDAKMSGIDDLFSAGGGLDLLPVGERAEESPGAGETVSTRKSLDFYTNGLDYDAVLSGYPNNDGGILKSMVEFTRAWGTRAAGVLLPGEGGLRMEYSLAIEEECRRQFVVSSDSDVYRHVFERRSLFLTREPLHRFKSFRGLCTEAAFAYIGRVLFVPVMFRKQNGYLLLGVHDDSNSIESMLSNAGMSLPDGTETRDQS